jgi:hypothetical protein
MLEEMRRPKIDKSVHTINEIKRIRPKGAFALCDPATLSDLRDSAQQPRPIISALQSTQRRSEFSMKT